MADIYVDLPVRIPNDDVAVPADDVNQLMMNLRTILSGLVPFTAMSLPAAWTGSIYATAGIVSALTPTGTGIPVFQNTPTLITPVLGVATATSLNKVTITPPASSATITIGNNKIFKVDNTLTFTGTDSSSVAFGTGGTVAYQGGTLAQFAATTSLELKGVISDETGSGSLVFGTTPTFTTSITSPIVIGGSDTTSSLILRATSGVGTTGANVIFQGGNNGATEFARFLNTGAFGVGIAEPSARIHSLATSEQLRLGYDISNYSSFTTSSVGNLTITTTGPSVFIPKVIQQTLTGTDISGSTARYFLSTTTYANDVALAYSDCADSRVVVNSGKTLTTFIGHQITHLRNYVSSGDVGTIGAHVGINLLYGTFNTDASTTLPISTTIKGIALVPYFRTGACTNFYDIYISTIDGSNVPTNRWSIYQEDTATKNYFGSNTGIGSTAPVSLLDVSSTTGGIITLSRNDTTATAADVIGKIQFWNNDTQLTTQNIYANIVVTSTTTVTTDAAQGTMKFNVTGSGAGGAPLEHMAFSPTTVAAIGFYGATPVVKPTALTNVTADAPAGGTGAAAGAWDTAQHRDTAISLINNLKIRVGELETKLVALGLLTSV